MLKYYYQNSQLIKTVVLICYFFVIANALYADQPADIPEDPESAPIDGGLSVIIAAGIGYAVKRIKQSVLYEKPE